MSLGLGAGRALSVEMCGGLRGWTNGKGMEEGKTNQRLVTVNLALWVIGSEKVVDGRPQWARFVVYTVNRRSARV